MQHTNAKRGSDGRFGTSETPKARRIEVYLQPTTVELLDTLCKQWNVGRGKVIDQLLTRGPVPPAAWSEVESKPAPAQAQPAPEPKADPEPTPSASPAITEDQIGDALDILEIGLHQAIAVKKAGGDPIKSLENFYAVTPEPEPAPEPTPSGRSMDPELKRKFAEIAAKGEAKEAEMKAEAKRIGITPKELREALASLNLYGKSFPFNPDLTEEIRQWVDAMTRARAAYNSRKEQLRWDVARILSEHKTLVSTLEEICSGASVNEKLAFKFVVERMPDFGLRTNKKPCMTLFESLRKVVPHCYSKNLLVWGVILRLPDLDIDEMPTDATEFLDWCGYNLITQYENEKARRYSERMWEAFANTFKSFKVERSTESEDRAVLGILNDGPLKAEQIKWQYRELAKQHHPDAGGDRLTFERITEARDRLLLTVA